MLTLPAQEDKSSDYYKELSDNIKLYFDILLTLNENYVDTANIEELMSEGIKAMLATTDPYTVLLKESEVDHYSELSTGSYGGIGIYLGTSGSEKRLTVISPMDDTPASKVGLKAGDQLIFIDSKDTKGMSVKDASDYLRGDPGSKLVLKVKRIGVETLLNFNLTRARINIQNVPFSEVIDNEVGYIKLTQFTATSYYDFTAEFEKLIAKGAKSLIIDLRFNPGGLLESAVKHCSAFLPKEKLVVSTKGRGSSIDNEYFTEITPIDTQIPLAILINGSSASASEIFAGSLQDHDRAVIIGEPSFGKGLVQQLFDVGIMKKRNLKVTVRKYYTASGRLIQKEDYFGDKTGNGTDTVFYKTLRTGRKVPSGIGIIPDVAVEGVKTSDYISSLKMNNYFSNFMYDFYLKFPDFKYNDRIEERVVTEFENYIQEKNFEYKSLGETFTDSLFAFSSENKYSDAILKQIELTLKEFKRSKENDFKNNLDEIRSNLSIEFGIYKNGNKEKYRITNQNDPQIRKAVELLKNQNEYKRILGY
jgi:carboxyl-terminal processing protease